MCRLWRKLVWGKTALSLFILRGRKQTSIMDPDLGWSLPRDFAYFFPIIKEKAKRYEKILLSTKIVKPNIGIIEPKTSIINAYPYDSSKMEAMEFHHLLFTKNYSHFYLPEEAILEGKVDLSDYKVLILPHATYFPEGLAKRLLGWIKSGGLLIASWSV